VTLRTYTYNSNGTVATMTEYLNPTNTRVTTYTWDTSGLNLTQTVVTGSGTSIQTNYTYDSLGRRTSKALLRGSVKLTTSYAYDALDHVTSVTDPSGNTFAAAYDANGKVTQTSYAGRIISNKTYNDADQLFTDSDVYGNTTSYAYDQSGNVTSVTDPNGHVTQYQYDSMNRRTAVTDGNGFTIQTVYDLAGHPVQVTNPLGLTTTTSYDPLGRPTAVTTPMAHTTSYSYDANGNVLTTTDPNGRTTSKTYDQLNRVVQETDASNQVTYYTYDYTGNMTSLKDANGNTTLFAYDNLGRLTSVTDPLSNTTSYTYDQANNVLTKTKPSGATTQYTYDNMNRRITAVYSLSGQTSITENTFYDTFGNVTSASNGSVTYTFQYDLKNRMTSKTDSRGGSLAFTYDHAGNVSTKAGYDGTTTTYLYDSANRLVSEQNPYYLQVSYYYDGAGRLLNRILSNNSKTTYTWDNDNRLATYLSVSANGSVIDNTTYTRDGIGNILTQADASGTTNYTYTGGSATYAYDPLYRLLNATYTTTGNNQSYTYDYVGNRLTMTDNSGTLAYVYDADNHLNQITQGQGGAVLTSFTYDADGNMTKKNGTVTQTISYDPKGRAQSITTSGIGTATTVIYDPYDYRISKTDSAGTKNYFLQGENIEAIWSGSNWTAMYFRGVVVDEVVNGYQVAPNGNWTNYTFHHDNLQSVLGLSGHDGTVLQTIAYDPFGNKISSGSATNDTLFFTGREQDPDTGLYYYRARYYDPTLGRFLTQDPKGLAAGVNFYAYANNNPINANDPYGLYPAIVVTLPDGTQYVPMTWVKNSAQARSFGVPQNTPVAIAVPPGVNPQSMVNTAADFADLLSDPVAFAGYWMPYGPNDFKRLNPMYDAAGNFLYGATGSAAGYSDITLQSAADVLSILLHGQRNNPINSMDIEQGYGAISLGGTLGITEYTPPQLSTNSNTSSLASQDTSATVQLSANINASSVPSQDTSASLDAGDESGAAGGYVIYPNMPNTNMTRSVYAK